MQPIPTAWVPGRLKCIGWSITSRSWAVMAARRDECVQRVLVIRRQKDGIIECLQNGVPVAVKSLIAKRPEAPSGLKSAEVGTKAHSTPEW